LVAGESSTTLLGHTTRGFVLTLKQTVKENLKKKLKNFERFVVFLFCFDYVLYFLSIIEGLKIFAALFVVFLKMLNIMQ
jgi:hypothetical protein